MKQVSYYNFFFSSQQNLPTDAVSENKTDELRKVIEKKSIEFAMTAE